MDLSPGAKQYLAGIDHDAEDREMAERVFGPGSTACASTDADDPHDVFGETVRGESGDEMGQTTGQSVSKTEQELLLELGLTPQDLAALSIDELEEALGRPCSEELLKARSGAAEYAQWMASKEHAGRTKRVFPGPPTHKQPSGKVKKAAVVARCVPPPFYQLIFFFLPKIIMVLATQVSPIGWPETQPTARLMGL